MSQNLGDRHINECWKERQRDLMISLVEILCILCLSILEVNADYTVMELTFSQSSSTQNTWDT